MKKIYFTIIASLILFNIKAQLSYQNNCPIDTLYFPSETNEIKITADPGPDACVSACVAVFLSEFAWYFVEKTIDHHEFVLDNRIDGKYQEAISLNMILNAGSGSNEGFSVSPRLKATWGVLGMDFRMSNLTYFKSNIYQTQQNFEWQFFQLCFYPHEQINLRFGTGLQYDLINDDVLSQYYAGIELANFQNKFLIGFEGRYTEDYNDISYSEASLNFGIRLFTNKHVSTYWNVGGSFNEYAEYLGFETGLRFSLH